jgi:EAL domain-containing protein (putative c-di-GMP-specific phosphodiesterase class I)/AmiR/NasT family two-component response regulator
MEVRDVAARSALVIDDQPEVREYLATMLETLGFGRIVRVGNGRDALAAVTTADTPFDLIFCDLQMPGSDGVETLRALATLGVTSWLIVMSVEERRIIESVGLSSQALGLRVLGSVRKPIQLGELSALVEGMATSDAVQELPSQLAPEDAIPEAFRLGELRLFYQPKVRVATREFVAVEALVRWQHPTLGLFQPGAFVPAIERSADLTQLLNDYALRTAIACAGRWRSAGREMRVAVNLTASAFERVELPEQIERIARDAEIPNEWVTLEVTETQVARDATRMSEVAARLRLKRFHLSIDDFGTGQSGLSQLRKLPFDELKIDRQFVDGCAVSITQRSVVEASLALARDLGMTSVAEGVEAEADWDLLHRLGCDVAQGYYVGRAMAEGDLGKWADRWKSESP